MHGNSGMELHIWVFTMFLKRNTKLSSLLLLAPRGNYKRSSNVRRETVNIRTVTTVIGSPVSILITTSACCLEHIIAQPILWKFAVMVFVRLISSLFLSRPAWTQSKNVKCERETCRMSHENLRRDKRFESEKAGPLTWTFLILAEDVTKKGGEKIAAELKWVNNNSDPFLFLLLIDQSGMIVPF